jgi:hypothetical protein
MQFRRALSSDKALADSYRALGSNQSKADFRLKWASLKLADAHKTSYKAEKSMEEELKEGRYLPFRKVWDAEGCDMEGYKAS